jgi:hypothetical protein|tara:strand:- start:1108 stop:1353 length:246 start_codon:yes stop_codon:yes gene_type:complete
MTVSAEKKKEMKKEVKYLEDKQSIKSIVKNVGYESILRYMVEDLDHIDDVNNTQSLYLFEIISLIEKVLEIYPRLKNVRTI